MASKLPVVKQVAWLSLIPQIILLVIIFSVCSRFFPEYPYVIGFSIYFIVFYLLRTLIPSCHRRGVKLFRKKRYEEAIPCFQESYSFFSRNPWLDKYRFLTMLSSSRISYVEMALLNEAFCLAQLERKAEAIGKYETVLQRFPDSEMAISALKMLK